MPQFVQSLKTEVIRLARKEIRAEIQALRKSSAQYRADIAALKRQLAEQQRLLGRSGKPSRQTASEKAPGEKSLRFRAGGFATLRKKLGLSSADMGKLIGVSLQTIYHWERGQSKPRASQLARIAQVRKLGKKAAMARLNGEADS